METVVSKTHTERPDSVFFFLPQKTSLFLEFELSLTNGKSRLGRAEGRRFLQALSWVRLEVENRKCAQKKVEAEGRTRNSVVSFSRVASTHAIKGRVCRKVGLKCAKRKARQCLSFF